MKQTITVVLDLKEGQQPYMLKEGRDYEALLHFFEDIDYKVETIKVLVGQTVAGAYGPTDTRFSE